MPKRARTEEMLEKLGYEMSRDDDELYYASSILPTDETSGTLALKQCEGGNFRSGADIAVFEADEATKRAAQSLMDFSEGKVDQENLEPILECFLPALKQSCNDEESIEILGPTAKFELHATTTKNEVTGKLTGLHIDNWEGKHFVNRAGRRNRISINCGRRDRYLLFFPFLVSDVIKESDEPKSRADIRASIYDLVLKYGDQGMVRLKIPPMHCYIAPTENIVHDGQFLNREELDITFVSLGRFSASQFRDQLNCYELVQ
ncbi:MAG: hypothetical protein AAGG02_19020 [Cyanobacteria bacterium P01_H01_bin.15]